MMERLKSFKVPWNIYRKFSKTWKLFFMTQIIEDGRDFESMSYFDILIALVFPEWSVCRLYRERKTPVAR